MPRARPARAAGDGLARRLVAACRDPARRRPAGARRPAAGPGQRLGRRRRRRPPGEPARYGMGGRKSFGASSPRTAGSTRVDEALRQALVNLAAVPAPAGTFDVVLGPRLAGRPAARGGRPRAGGRLQPQEDLGLRRPDGPAGRAPGRHRRRRRHHPDRRGSLTVDDEGTPTGTHVLIEDGILVGYMQDRQNARLMGMAPTGNGRREVLCPQADAAHDQHLHARRHRTTRARSSPRSRTASTPSPSAAARSTSPAASSCSPAPRPT